MSASWNLIRPGGKTSSAGLPGGLTSTAVNVLGGVATVGPAPAPVPPGAAAPVPARCTAPATAGGVPGAAGAEGTTRLVRKFGKFVNARATGGGPLKGGFAFVPGAPLGFAGGADGLTVVSGGCP